MNKQTDKRQSESKHNLLAEGNHTKPMHKIHCCVLITHSKDMLTDYLVTLVSETKLKTCKQLKH